MQKNVNPAGFFGMIGPSKNKLRPQFTRHFFSR